MILGLTGAFGGGKSTVLRYFSQHGWQIFDADAACHQIYESGNDDLLRAVRELFGENAVTPDKKINRRVIAQSAFSHPEKLEELTGVLYPLLNKMMEESIASCKKDKINAILELPLLYENGYEKYFDAVLAIWTDPELRRQRLRNRNYSPEDMAKRDARQLDPAIKLERADYAVINNGSEELLCQQLDALLKRPEFK